MSLKSILPKLLLLGAMVLLLASCGSDASKNAMPESEDFGKAFQKKLIEAKPGSTIDIPEGRFELNRPLSFNDVANVTIKGAGMGKSVLSFKDQKEGGEGLLIKSADGITLQDFTVADAKGDGIKIQDSKNVTMRAVETNWKEKSPSNGAYGLYPVTCDGVLMENCRASNAMDAGIYVGQSKNAIVRNNYVHDNVAGIEVENTTKAEIYGNKAINNTAGLLIFDMPDLPHANGSNIKVYDNIVENNNGENFSAEGIVVNILPPGTGLLLMAHRDIDVYNNTISGHNTVSVALNSWLFTGRPYKKEGEYDPFCHDIYVYDNDITLGTGAVDTTTDFGKLFASLNGGKPLGIATDGIFNPEHLTQKGTLKEGHRVCFYNNGNLPFLNLNAHKAMSEKGLDYQKLATVMSHDGTAFDCKPTP